MPSQTGNTAHRAARKPELGAAFLAPTQPPPAASVLSHPLLQVLFSGSLIAAISTYCLIILFGVFDERGSPAK